MTVQVSDELINERPSVNFDGLHVYGVIRGNPETNHGWGEKYEFRRKPIEHKGGTSACWRGHISTYKLCEDSQLKLIGYRYPSRIPLSMAESEDFEEALVGDFWMVMKPSFLRRDSMSAFAKGSSNLMPASGFFKKTGCLWGML